MKYPYDNKNIILIGMPASGKSTVGVLLAKTIGASFVDTDLVLQSRENRLLQDIIDNDGIEVFLDKECSAVLSIEAKRSVIATGGSVIYREKAMEHLRSLGVIIYLNVSVPELEKRLNNIKTRGVAAEKGKSIDSIFRERASLYEKYANITIDSESFSSEETVNLICEKIS